MIIRTGTYLDLILLIVLVVASWYYMNKAIRGEKLPMLRKIPAIDAIVEGVGRSIEQDRPVHYAMGASGGQLYSTLVSMTLAGIAMLRYIAKLCARYGARLIVHMPYQAESIPLIEATAREGYLEEGKPEMFRLEDLRYYGQGSLTWTQGVTSSFAQEGVGLNLEVGIFYSDCPISLEMAKIMGGMNVGGTGRWIMVYAFAMMCDYVFLGEEIYAAGAIVSDNPLMLSGIVIEEVGKYFVFLLLAIGIVLAAIGLDVGTLLSM
ncbi:MAG: hypothetical protein DRI26_00640 [Chloroflexi bacterium]|nr:MAG: hypothetical protein DRI26_00640 [Chloroflexota bacterium]